MRSCVLERHRRRRRLDWTMKGPEQGKRSLTFMVKSARLIKARKKERKIVKWKGTNIPILKVQ